MLLIIVITFLEVLGQNQILANLDSISKIFSKFSGIRFTSYFDSFTAESRIDCCSACVSRDGCLAVNYESSTKQCQFVPPPLHTTQPNIAAETATGWDIYAIDGMLTFYLI